MRRSKQKWKWNGNEKQNGLASVCIMAVNSRECDAALQPIGIECFSRSSRERSGARLATNEELGCQILPLTRKSSKIATSRHVLPPSTMHRRMSLVAT